jgi:hypothetical protein
VQLKSFRHPLGPFADLTRRCIPVSTSQYANILLSKSSTFCQSDCHVSILPRQQFTKQVSAAHCLQSWKHCPMRRVLSVGFTHTIDPSIWCQMVVHQSHVAAFKFNQKIEFPLRSMAPLWCKLCNCRKQSAHAMFITKRRNSHHFDFVSTPAVQQNIRWNGSPLASI